MEQKIIVKKDFAITENLFSFARELGLEVTAFRDLEEKQLIGKVCIDEDQYEKLLCHAEDVGGFIVRFDPKKSTSLSVMPGMLFYTCWGYDQTNCDFVVVDSVSPSGKTVVCRRAMYVTVDNTEQTDILKPKSVGYGKSFRMKVVYNDYGIPSLRGSYIYCGGEDSDSKRFGCFRIAREEETYEQTNPLFGH